MRPPAVRATHRATRRRTATLVALVVLAALAAAALTDSLASRAVPRPADAPASGRPASAAQVSRLAGVRSANLDAGQTAFTATINDGQVRLSGWIDWRRPSVYLNSVGRHPGPADGLIQAVPGLIATHAGRFTTTVPAGDGGYPPPAEVPTNGWKVRRLRPDGTGSAYDALVATLFRLAGPAGGTGTAGPGRVRFLGTERIAGVPVEILESAPVPLASPPPGAGAPSGAATPSRTPAGPPPPSPSQSPSLALSAPPGGDPAGARSPAAPVVPATRYWLDPHGRPVRLRTTLGAGLPVQVDFQRLDRAVPQPIVELGGAPVRPHPVTTAQAGLLAAMRTANRAAGGGTLLVSIPVDPDGTITGTGWLDWRSNVAYLAVACPDDSGGNLLLRADRRGVATRAGPLPPAGTAPTLGPPRGGWQATTWAARTGVAGDSDLDLLLTLALHAAGRRAGDAGALLRAASFLRQDTLRGQPALVFEVRAADETAVAPGAARLRYWLDPTGLLLRIQARTTGGALATLDVVAGPVPALPRPVR